MDDLVVWLLKQVADDERVAHQVNGEFDDELAIWVIDDDYKHNDLGVTRRRVLAECESKRLIIAEHTTLHTVVDGFCTDCTEEGATGTHPGEAECSWCGGENCRTLRLVALPYADRPGYREEWRP